MIEQRDTSPTTSIKEDASFEMYAFDDLSSNFSCDDKTSSTCQDSMDAPSSKKSLRSRGSASSSTASTSEDDERTVKGARCMFLFVLLLIASALCGVVYFITKNEEEDDFNAQVRKLILQLVSFALTMDPMDSLAGPGLYFDCSVVV